MIVFVHGLNSNSDACWKNLKAGTYWPHLVTSDPQFEDPAVFLAGYDTGFGAGRFDAYDAMEAVRAALTAPSVGASPLDKDRILFVCHSQGGVIIRKLLTSHWVDFSNKLVGLALCASPSWGSWYGQLLLPITRLFGIRQAQQLRRSDPTLVNLDRDFKTLRDANADHIRGIELVETRGLFRIFWRVVPEDSATRYFQGWTRIPRVSHGALVKPDSHQHAAHSHLRAFAVTEGFCTGVRLRKSVRKVLRAMTALSRAYDSSNPRSSRSKSEADAQLRTVVHEALAHIDRTDRELGLGRLLDAPLDSGGAWAFADLSRQEFEEIRRQLEHFAEGEIG